MQVLLVSFFTVLANDSCYVSWELNHFLKSFQVVNIKKCLFLQTWDLVFMFWNLIHLSLKYFSDVISSKERCVMGQFREAGIKFRGSGQDYR